MRGVLCATTTAVYEYINIHTNNIHTNNKTSRFKIQDGVLVPVQQEYKYLVQDIKGCAEKQSVTLKYIDVDLCSLASGTNGTSSNYFVLLLVCGTSLLVSYIRTYSTISLVSKPLRRTAVPSKPGSCSYDSCTWYDATAVSQAVCYPVQAVVCTGT